ncbi:MAG: TonB-dependent receptor [Flavobacteriales bacterium]|nr:TonB-dependent receptor [Flavobacteriales bacterium]
MEQTAAYVNNSLQVSDKVTLDAGLRYNQVVLESDFRNNIDFFPFPFADAEINKGALTGSIGGVYRPQADWAIKVNFGTAFRAPNVDDVGKVFDSEQGNVVVPNPGLDPEYAYNVDLGIAKVFGDAVKIDLTGYYTILQNAMVRRDFRLNGLDSIVYDGTLSQVQAIQNAAEASVYGIQAGIDVKLPSGFNFLTDLNFQVGEEELDDGSTSTSRHAAPFFGVSRLRYQNEALTLELNATYQGERSHSDLAVSERGKVEIYALDANGQTYAPAWYTLNLRANYQLTEVFSVSGGVENLTDQRYRPYSSGLSGAGRNFILSLRAEF